VLYNRGLGEHALRSVKRSLEINPENPDALYLLGFILGDLGRNDEAADASRRALTLNPTLTRAQANLSLETARDSAEPRAQPPVNEGSSQVELAFAYRQKGMLDEATAAYKRALASPGSEAPALQGLLELGLLKRDVDAALETGARLVREFPATPKALNEYGVALQMSGELDAAEERYCAALDLDGQYSYAHNNLGVVLWHKGDARAAVNAFRRALQPAAPPMEARLNLALALYLQKHFDLALEAYRQVVRVNSTHPVAWNGIGLILVDLERFEEARNAFARAIQAQPDFAEAHYNMSFTLSRLGDFNAALRETKQALALDPLYSVQKLALAIEAADTGAPLFVGPALSGTSFAGQQIPDFHFDPAVLADIFAPDAAPEPSPVFDPSSFALARDYLSLDR
jgi:tetratricopeptide (TPR) repeat protein